MNPLLPLLSAPAALSAVQLAKEATSTLVQPFAAMLASYSIPHAVPASSGDQSGALANLRDEIGQRLGDLFHRRNLNSENLRSSTPFRLRIDSSNRTIKVEGSHPDASWLEGEIASDEDLSRAIDQLAILSRQAEGFLTRAGSGSFLAELTPPSSLGGIVSLRWL